MPGHDTRHLLNAVTPEPEACPGTGTVVLDPDHVPTHRPTWGPVRCPTCRQSWKVRTISSHNGKLIPPQRTVPFHRASGA